MTKIPCDIIRDLMPLVLDGVASEDSRAAVQQHIAECSPCAAAFADMQTAAPQPVEKDASFISFCRRLRRSFHLRTLLVVLIALLLIGFAALQGYTWVDGNINRCNALAPIDCATARAGVDENGNLVCTITPNPDTGFWDWKSNYWGREWKESDEDILYITPTQPAWLNGRTGSTDADSITFGNFFWQEDELHFILYDYTIIEQNGEPIAIEDPTHLLLDKTIREVRWGNEDDYIVLYAAGDTLQPVSD